MKKKNIFIISFSFFILYGSFAAAGNNSTFLRDDRKSFVGVIQKINLNTIVVLDEVEKNSRRFVYLDKNKRFHKGDRVRLFYRTKGNLVENMKKMAPVKYKKDGQNGGYILKKD